ncbi:MULTISPECIES: hypothetical protein [Arenibacter]|uniref:hypothetical protein n=1 Tax=Arenibacter TaxID=178469 RepID=UPI000A36B191|nr:MULTISPECIES: hypothetical protein [Arenibacter]
MKTTALFWVWATTLVLVSLAIMSGLNLPFNWVFYGTVVGQIMVVYMVYRVLTDPYSTQKTFDDFYEDHPMDS